MQIPSCWAASGVTKTVKPIYRVHRSFDTKLAKEIFSQILLRIFPCRGGEKENRKRRGWGYGRLEIEEKYLSLTYRFERFGLLVIVSHIFLRTLTWANASWLLSSRTSSHFGKQRVSGFTSPRKVTYLPSKNTNVKSSRLGECCVHSLWKTDAVYPLRNRGKFGFGRNKFNFWMRV